MKKRNLIMIALMLVSSISVVSVLMLLSSKTGTANNTVMMSNGINAKLVETDKPGNNDWIDAKDDQITLQYPTRMPGDVIIKKPRVVRTDEPPESAANAYVAVKMQLMALLGNKASDEISLSNKDGLDKLNDILLSAKEDGTTPYTFTTDNVITLFETILNGIYYEVPGGTVKRPLSPDWKYFKDEYESNTGWFFYVKASESESARSLKVLHPMEGNDHAATDVIFTNIKIPDNLSPMQLELYSVLAHANVELYLKFTAYLAQSDNSPYKGGTTFEDYKQAFPQITFWSSQEGH